MRCDYSRRPASPYWMRLPSAAVPKGIAASPSWSTRRAWPRPAAGSRALPTSWLRRLAEPVLLALAYIERGDAAKEPRLLRTVLVRPGHLVTHDVDAVAAVLRGHGAGPFQANVSALVEGP